MFSKISAISMTLLVATHADQVVDITGYPNADCAGSGTKASSTLPPGCFKIPQTDDYYGTNMCNATGYYQSRFTSSDCSGTPDELPVVPFGVCIQYGEDGFDSITLDSCVNNA